MGRRPLHDFTGARGAKNRRLSRPFLFHLNTPRIALAQFQSPLRRGNAFNSIDRRLHAGFLDYFNSLFLGATRLKNTFFPPMMRTTPLSIPLFVAATRSTTPMPSS